MHAVLSRLRLALAVLLCAAALCAAAFAADSGVVKEKKEKALFAIGTDTDGLERGRLVAELAELDDEGGAKALVEVIRALADRQSIVDAIHLKTLAEYEPFKSYRPKERVEGYWDKKKALLDKLDDEEARIQGLSVVAQATLIAVNKMKDPAALTVLDRASSAEGDWHARIVYFGGLLGNPAFKAADLAKRALKDDVAQVRIAAIDGIAARKDPSMRELVEKALLDPGWPIRLSAVHALAVMKDVKSVPALVAAMQTEEPGLLEHYAKTLADLTGQTLGHFPDAWRKWYDDHKDEFTSPGGRPATAKPAPKQPPLPVDYYGVQTISKRILFVIDISGSMKEPIGTEAGEQTGVARKDQVSGPKIDIAKSMLVEAISKLEKTSSFNVVWFNHEVGTFQDKMLLATDENKGKAQVFVDELQPVGATWALGALRRAFEFAGVTGAPVTGKFDPQVDTIFFLSDGAPTDESIDKAKPMDPKVILDAVREWNRLAKMQVNTIAIDPRIGGGTMVRFMKTLASENGGTYTAIGAK